LWQSCRLDDEQEGQKAQRLESNKDVEKYAQNKVLP